MDMLNIRLSTDEERIYKPEDRSELPRIVVKDKKIKYERRLRPSGQNNKFKDRSIGVPEGDSGDQGVFKKKLSGISRWGERH